MKTQDIIVKQGFAVIVAFYYNTCLLKNSVTTILKVYSKTLEITILKVVKIVCKRTKPPAAGQFLQFFGKKAILTPFG